MYKLSLPVNVDFFLNIAACQDREIDNSENSVPSWFDIIYVVVQTLFVIRKQEEAAK